MLKVMQCYSWIGRIKDSQILIILRYDPKHLESSMIHNVVSLLLLYHSPDYLALKESACYPSKNDSMIEEMP